jgi:pimeloyl-ACP methyl ester carboxylesterase
MQAQSRVALSSDGVPIHYDVQGSGPIALVFVHGWCCNRGYWAAQVDHFATRNTVVNIDLAGHGASGRERARWTMSAFGLDVVAVIEHLELQQVVMVGHSMGGVAIVEAACRLPDSVIGLVGVDTWRNLEQVRTPAQVASTAKTARGMAVGGSYMVGYVMVRS